MPLITSIGLLTNYTVLSQWYRRICLSIGQERFQSRQSNHHRFNFQSRQGSSTLRRRDRGPKYVVINQRLCNIYLTRLVIDYTKENPTKAITPRSVDFVFDTMGQAMDMLPIMRGKYSVIVSVSTLPSGQTLQNAPIMRGRKRPSVPLYARIFLDLGDAYRRWRAWCWGVTYMYIFLEPNAKDLEKMTQWVEDGKVKAVVGTTVQMQDINGTIKALEVVAKGKGGLGKTVIKVT